MMLIGVDYHPSFQRIAFFIEETGECGEREPSHALGVSRERFGQDLNGYVAAELGVVGAIDLSRPSRAKGRLNLKRPEFCA
jgi:hypothetical protein